MVAALLALSIGATATPSGGAATASTTGTAILADAPGATVAVEALARAAVEAAIAVPDGRAELLGLEGALPRCTADVVDAPRPITTSGRTALRLHGHDRSGRACDGWAWARVRVTGPALVTTRAVAEGESLTGAVTTRQREVEPGHPVVTELPEGARATRALPAGAPLDPALIRVGPLPGDAVTVTLLLGYLRVDEEAHATSCRAGRACAVLPSGRRVEGFWHDGRIVIGSP